nr:plexin-A3 [Chrysemys picta bellii]
MAAPLLLGALALLLLLPPLARAGAPPPPLPATRVSFSVPDGGLTHLAVHRETGEVFAGAVNRVYKLAANLSQLRVHGTGPVPDDARCYPPPAVRLCQHPLAPADNVNKLLLLDYAGGRLVACGSVWQGVCQLLRLGDLAKLGEPHQRKEHYLSGGREADAMAGVILEQPGQPSRLFVGTSVEGRSEYFPTLSSRRLAPDPASPDMFSLVYQDEFVSSQVKVPSDTLALHPAFDIYYVSAFVSGAFVYFLTLQLDTQQAALEGPGGGPGGGTAPGAERFFSSKIVRLCARDAEFYSYVEFPLGCAHAGVEYRLVQAARLAKAGRRLARALGLAEGQDVLYAAFAQGQKNRAAPPRQSLLCLFTLDEVNRRIQERIQSCYRGEGHLSLPWLLNKELPCINTVPGPRRPGASPSPRAQPLGPAPLPGREPRSGRGAGFGGSREVAQVGLGTRGAGGISLSQLPPQVRVDGPQDAHLYESVPVTPGQPLLRDMELSPDQRHLYLLSRGEVVRLPVETCGQYPACDACLGSGDPHCGWCVLHNRCCRESECPRALELQRFAAVPGPCPRLLVEPNNISVTSTSVLLQLTVQNLPDLGPGVTCSFEGLGQSKAEVLPGGLIRCQSPTPRELPPGTGPHGDARSVRLQLRSLETMMDFAGADFVFYNCSLLPSCLSCVRSQFACQWCKYRHVCTHDPRECAFAEGRVSTAEGCPELLPAGEILIPVGVLQPITLRAKNLPQPQSGQKNYECVFAVQGRRQRVPAVRFNSSSVQCQNTSYWYEGDAVGELPVDFSVVWDSDFPIDQPPGFKALLYKCPAQRPSCGLCLRSDPRYECGWCLAERRCLLRAQCPAPKLNWVPPGRRGARCSHPRITQVVPVAGPKEGGTRVTVEGENLGLQFHEVAVRVAGVRCNSLPSQYVPAQRGSWDAGEFGGTCLIGRELGREGGSGGDDTPRLRGLNPGGGPVSGGTRVTLTGTHLDAGSSVNISLQGAPCQLLRRGPEEIVCMTPPSTLGPGPAPLSVCIDRASLAPPEPPNGTASPPILIFRYTPDPVVTHIEPQWSIVNGSTSLTVTGTRLLSIQEPRVRALYGGVETVNSCRVLNDSLMLCQAPGIVPGGRELPAGGASPDEFGFLLDHVQAARTLNRSAFTYYPDPQVEPFGPAGVLEVKPGSHIVLKGRNLIPAAAGGARLNYTVLIGGEPCALTVSETQLLCDSPSQTGEQPVTILVGGLSFSPGSLHIYPEAALPLGALVGLGVGGSLLLLAIIGVLVAYKRKTRDADRTLKRLQLQMDNLESRVALECKEAFAELQTDINELTNNLDGVKIPFLDYRTYALRVLFPGEEPPMLRHGHVSGGRARVGCRAERGLGWGEEQGDWGAHSALGQAPPIVLRQPPMALPPPNLLPLPQVTDGSKVALAPRQVSGCNLPNSCTFSRSLSRYESLLRPSSSPDSLRSRAPMLSPERDGGTRLWHLVRSHDPLGDPKEGGSKMVSEIYLTRLLATKGTLQKFVDDLFETLFSTAHRASALPLPIKYMFDFLDEQADRRQISDPDVRHTWKSNCLPLRFWVNVIKNPQFVFDVHKSSITDACLSVVAQTFMDSCSTSPQRLGKDSPSTKLLYAKDLPGYRGWVERYYRDIARMAPISDQDMDAYLGEQSRLHAGEFNTLGALGELYQYVGRYRQEVLTALERDGSCRKQRLRQRLEQVIALVSTNS